MYSNQKHKRSAVLVILLAAFSLFAAACSNSTSGTNTGNAGGGLVEDPVPEEVKTGGNLIVAVEAETAAGFTPGTAQWDVGGYVRANAVLEPLFKPTPEGEYEPFLLESAEPSDDYMEWTFTVRPGIKFHNGEDLTAEIVAKNLLSAKTGFVTGQALNFIQDVQATDEMVVTITLNSPHVALPATLSAQGGYIVADEQLQQSASNPGGISNAPIGTGPFVFAEFVPGSVNFRATKNENYWRTDETGNSLPYLDSIEFQTIPDAVARLAALKSGAVDVMMSTSGTSIAELRNLSNQYRVQEYTDYTETGYILLNVTKAPLDDVRIREALALAMDRDLVRQRINAGVGELANGPFPPGAIGYLEDSGYPMTPDVARARQLVEEYKQDKGVSTVTFPFVSTPDSESLATIQLYQAMWKDVGIDVTLKQIEQSQFIGLAITGDFHAFTWRNHWGADPTMQHYWWHSENAQGDIALNFGRFQDDVIDANLEAIRQNPDPAARQEAAENINRRFAEQFYNLWGTYTIWTYATKADVIGFNEVSFPNGDPVGTGIGGHSWFSETWLNR